MTLMWGGRMLHAEIRHPSARLVEWTCQHCGKIGPGFPPEEHASGQCEVSRTAIIAAPVGFMDGAGI